MLKTVSLAMTAQTYDHDSTRLATRLAKLLAGRLKAHFIRPDPRHAIAFMGEGLTADTIQTLCDNSEKDGLAAAEAAEAHLRSLAESTGLQWGEDLIYDTVVGPLSKHAGSRARVSDLSVCPQPRPDKIDASDLMNDLLFKSGRLMMMVPQGTQTVGRHGLIAWNGRVECARAVGASLPLLLQAERVTAVQIGDIGEARPDMCALEDYLAPFNLPLTCKTVEDSGCGIAPQLHALALDAAADYMVIGAYSHARWQEMILGGATRWLMENSRLPVVMSH